MHMIHSQKREGWSFYATLIRNSIDVCSAIRKQQKLGHPFSMSPLSRRMVKYNHPDQTILMTRIGKSYIEGAVFLHLLAGVSTCISFPNQAIWFISLSITWFTVSLMVDITLFLLIKVYDSDLLIIYIYTHLLRPARSGPLFLWEWSDRRIPDSESDNFPQAAQILLEPLSFATILSIHHLNYVDSAFVRLLRVFSIWEREKQLEARSRSSCQYNDPQISSKYIPTSQRPFALYTSVQFQLYVCSSTSSAIWNYNMKLQN